jgi:uncharacterized membrane protein YkoI
MLGGAVFVSASVQLAYAEGDDHDDDEKNEGESEEQDSAESIRSEQNSIKNAEKNDQAASLSSLISYLSKNYPGEILNVGLLRKRDQYFYVIKILTAQGNIVKLKLDAKTLAEIRK